jgi:hypothetical protein
MLRNRKHTRRNTKHTPQPQLNKVVVRLELDEKKELEDFRLVKENSGLNANTEVLRNLIKQKADSIRQVLGVRSQILEVPPQ